VAWGFSNRIITWGWVPFPKRLLPASFPRRPRAERLYLVGTAQVFSVVNEEGILIGDPNSLRLPSYFSINLHFEKKFRFLHYLWAWRFGINNLTNNGNPNAVNNNVIPPLLAYGRGQHRAFSVRLRFLGKR
jgi:hypothetical protein